MTTYLNSGLRKKNPKGEMNEIIFPFYYNLSKEYLFLMYFSFIVYSIVVLNFYLFLKFFNMKI